MVKQIGMTIFILASLTIISFPFLVVLILNNFEEDMFDIIYFNSLIIVWSSSILISAFMSVRKERKNNDNNKNRR